MNHPVMSNARLWSAYLGEARFEFVKSLRTPAFAVPTLLFPAMFYLLFGVLFGSARGNEAMAVYTFATYGVFGAMGPGLFGFGVSLAIEREQGLLTLKQALPQPPGAYLLARLGMAMLFVTIISLMLVAMATLLAGVSLTFGQGLTIFFINVLGAVPFCAIGLFIGTLVSGQAAPAIVNLIFLPMAFLSGLWVPLQFLPPVLGDIAPIWPAHHLAQLALATVGAPSSGSTIGHVVVLAGTSVAFFALAMRRMHGDNLGLFGARGPFARLAMVLTVVVGFAGMFHWVAGSLGHAATPAPAPAKPAEITATFAVRNVRLFDGERVIEGASLVVRDGRISALGSDLAMPNDIEVIDGAGKTLLPGLVDAHVHTYGASPRSDALRFGVTTEIDLFTDRSVLAEAKRQRESLARTQLADLYSAGTLVTVAGGHGTEYGMRIPTLDSPDATDAFVADRVREGSDFIKIILEPGGYGRNMPSLTPQHAAAVVGAAHAQGKLAIVHVSSERDATTVVGAGADVLAHIFADRVASEAFVALARPRGTCVVPTLTVIDTIGGGSSAARLVADPAVAGALSAEQSAMLKSRFPGGTEGDWRARYLGNARENVRLLRAAGVPILAGTDAGNPGTSHGASLHGELELLVAAGLSPVEALRAATTSVTRCLNLTDRGRIAIGERADLLLVDGDPTTDVSATRRIVAVWKNGYAVGRAVTTTATTSAAAATSGAPAGVISDFDDGKPIASFGSWAGAADEIRGGKSSAAIAVVAGGAESSSHSLEIAGELRAGIPYIWGGAMFYTGPTPMVAAVDLSARTELAFHARGDGRTYSVMVFSGASVEGMPAIMSLPTGNDWQEHRIALKDFAGADLTTVRAIGFMAGGEPGAFRMQIDAVQIR